MKIWKQGLNVPIVQGLQLLDSVEDSERFTLEESFRQFLETIHNPGSLEFEVPKVGRADLARLSNTRL